MSNPRCDSGAMKKNTAYCPVILEPELEEETALLTPGQRLALARKFQRWARQLEVSANIMLRNQKQASEPKPPPCLKAVSARVLFRN